MNTPPNRLIEVLRRLAAFMRRLGHFGASLFQSEALCYFSVLEPSVPMVFNSTVETPTPSQPPKKVPSRRRRVLYTKDEIVGKNACPNLPAWGFRSFSTFVDAILNKDFPCTFAGPGYRRGLYRFAFLPAPESAIASGEELAVALEEYLEWLKTLPQEDEAYAVLVTFSYPSDPTGNVGVERYREMFGKILVETNLRDTAPWPKHIPPYSTHPLASFCFGGRELFLNCNTPSNHKRRSRNFGPSMTLVIQPRDAFDKLATPQLREAIRSRIPKYDGGMAASPEIGSFGDLRNTEFNGYVLSDDNETAQKRIAEFGVCPFMAAKEENKNRLRKCPVHRLLGFFQRLKNLYLL